MPNLVNGAGIAERLQVSRPVVSLWVKRYRSFPKPLDLPGVVGIPIYDWDQVESWYAEFKKK